MTFVTRLLAPAACAFALATAANAQTPPPVQPVGTWSGTSKCTEQAVICEDQTVVIRVTKDAQPLLYDVDFTTVSAGVETPENHLVMVYNDTKHVLTARFNDERKRLNFYALAVKEDNMAGVLLVNDKVIERTLNLKRTAAEATPLPWAGSGTSSSSTSSSSSSSSQ